jgi:hypothetical protein
MNETATNNRPVTSFRSGALQVAIWKTTKNGNTYYSAAPTRSYTTDEGKTWHYATDFGQQELPIIAALLTRSWEWMLADRLRQPPATAAS